MDGSGNGKEFLDDHFREVELTFSREIFHQSGEKTIEGDILERIKYAGRIRVALLTSLAFRFSSLINASTSSKLEFADWRKLTTSVSMDSSDVK